MRIGGIASGFDTGMMVRDLMRAERMPIEKIFQQKQLLEWKQESYRDLNKTLFSFRDKLFDLRLQGTFNSKAAVSSNENAIGVTASISAVKGIYEVTVSNLASGVSRASTAEMPKVYDSENQKNKTLFKQFEEEFQSRGFEEGGEVTDISFTLNDKEFTFNIFSDTIYNVVSQINSESQGVSASYDSTHNRFFITTTSTGSEAKIEITDDVSSFLATDSNPEGYESMLRLNIVNGEVYVGQDVLYDFGDAQGLKSSTNTATINGLILTFKEKGDTLITVSNDTEAAFDKIKYFIDTYNQLIEDLNSKLSEQSYRDFPPLNEEQKKEMSEKEIDIWEAKAKSGLFGGDRILMNLATNMRRFISDTIAIDSEYNSLSQIGISTRSWQEGGKLHIDEAKLRQVLAEDTEGVRSLFTSSSENISEQGIARRLYDIVLLGAEQITEKAGRETGLALIDNSFIGKRISGLNDRINIWENRLIQIENRYWKQFTQMERVLNEMNNQSMWLSQQFWSGN